ncbi:hypothetical protein P0D72_39720 [Paraburkholderia sediminicola]|uniref:hypothetical protein n=1 Tax=Paraburkholderia sediminicola TaxID=458836 RepID=UPI0038BDC287
MPVLIGAASFEEKKHQGVAFLLDLSDRKRAEAVARESEQRYREVQMELAHANRASTMGQLLASIVHEVKQPITATIAYANAACAGWRPARPISAKRVRRSIGLSRIASAPITSSTECARSLKRNRSEKTASTSTKRFSN